MPSRLILAASGKVDADALLALAERLFGDMAAGPEPAIEPARFTRGLRNDRRVFEQAHWCLGLAAALRSADPQCPALSIFVQALGGGTSSRLFQELREERGLAYSIYAWAHGFADTGLVGIGCAADQRPRGRIDRACPRSARADGRDPERAARSSAPAPRSRPGS